MPTDADLVAIQQAVTAALQTVANEGKKTSAVLKEAAGPSGGFGSLNAVIKNLTTTLNGPVGMAAAVYAVAESLKSFATNRVQLQFFAQDVGFTTKEVSRMQAAMADMGIDAKAAQGHVATLGGALQQLHAMGPGGSKIGTTLLEMGEGKFAEKLKETEDQAKQLDMLGDKFKSFNDKARIYFSKEMGIPESVLLKLKEFIALLKVDPYEASYQYSQNYLRNMNRFETELSNIWARIKDRVTEAADESVWAKITAGLKREVDDVSAIYGALKKLQEETLHIGEKPRNYYEELTGKQHPQDADPGAAYGSEPYGYGSLYKKPPWKAQGLPPFGMGITPNETFKDRFGQWPKQGGTSGATDFSGMHRSNELIEVENDSNKLLREVRDSLQRMETGGGAGGTGGSTGATGGGRGSLARRLGMSHGRGGGGGGGGFSDPGDSGEGSAGPNEYLAKERAEIFAQIDADPKLKNEVAATIAHEGNTKQGRGTLEAMVNRMAFIRKTQPNNPRGRDVWAELNSGFFGPRNRHEVGPASAAQLKSYDWAAAQVRAGSNTIDMRTDQGTWRSEVQQGVAGGTNVAGEGYAHWPSHGNWGAAQEWTRKQRELLGRPGPTGGPTFKDRWSETGAGDNKKFTYSGTDQSPVHARDMSQSLSQRIDAAMSASIDFKNMPSWVKTAVDDNGKFKKLSVTRSTPRAGNPGYEPASSPWSGVE